MGAVAKAMREDADKIDRLTAENERLRAAVEDAVETLEAMDMHIDNPLYARLRDALEQGGAARGE